MVGHFSSPITGRSLKAHKIMKPKHTRRIIRTHHTMMKKKASLESQLVKTADPGKLAELKEEISRLTESINESGGLDKYQQASIAGQSTTRGGDSSKILVDWLEEANQNNSISHLRMLEVGCLSVKNACSQSKLFSFIERIDLNSQDPQIKQEDFMKRPLPMDPEVDRFDIVSLSLVLNYVPDVETRGEMLYRTSQFLKSVTSPSTVVPALFLVLPSPCVNNSRYLNEERLLEILRNLGYRVTQRKEAKKVIYWLLTLEKSALTSKQFEKLQGKFKKKIVNDGKIRNNFTVTL